MPNLKLAPIVTCQLLPTAASGRFLLSAFLVPKEWPITTGNAKCP